MLGTRRRSPLHHVESERSPSKLPKNDALSIYEATLQKLRHGSHRAFASPIEGKKCEMAPDAGNACSNGGDNRSTVDLGQVEASNDGH
ncbi:hypothetical protein COCNU_08G003440 [Cocos nucifera]|uniref:Uncharacterized protein n=1 Tax=Cocos nucifera TaxID=13894 RepID=A0A8K0IH78_COCNU|nr:hypothetical protein COCNU_08G003440 [Cocos nucifera]